MKRLINIKITRKRLLQSLPIILVAIVFVIYGPSVLPYSAARMERSAAVVRAVSCCRLCVDGKPLLWFKAIGDDGLPCGWALSPDSTVSSTTYAAACWVNKYPYVSSCQGYLLAANTDSAAAKAVLSADGKARAVVRMAADSTAADILRLEHKAEEADYYMRTHNVNDDGYNVMAAYTARLDSDKKHAEKVLAALRKALTGKHLSMELVRKYAVAQDDTAGTITLKPCSVLTTDQTSPFLLLQTADQCKPDRAVALYLHPWLTMPPEAGDSIYAASVAGCTLRGFTPDGASAVANVGTADGNGGHDIPPLLAPDGSPLFTRGGFPCGISMSGRIIRPSNFGFAFSKLTE